eukprot:Sspe_Gene.69285::Locus_40837_Transcript_1_1_Confidence_1.000_Length_1424::g.69285::m.69285
MILRSQAPLRAASSPSLSPEIAQVAETVPQLRGNGRREGWGKLVEPRPIRPNPPPAARVEAPAPSPGVLKSPTSLSSFDATQERMLLGENGHHSFALGLRRTTGKVPSLRTSASDAMEQQRLVEERMLEATIRADQERADSNRVCASFYRHGLLNVPYQPATLSAVPHQPPSLSPSPRGSPRGADPTAAPIPPPPPPPLQPRGLTNPREELEALLGEWEAEKRSREIKHSIRRNENVIGADTKATVAWLQSEWANEREARAAKHLGVQAPSSRLLLSPPNHAPLSPTKSSSPPPAPLSVGGPPPPAFLSTKKDISPAKPTTAPRTPSPGPPPMPVSSPPPPPEPQPPPDPTPEPGPPPPTVEAPFHLEPGVEVSAYWKGEWLPAVVHRVSGGAVDIWWEDSTFSENVAFQYIRPRDATSPEHPRPLAMAGTPAAMDDGGRREMSEEPWERLLRRQAE